MPYRLLLLPCRFQCAASGRELASLSALLREANATIDASKGSMQNTLAKQVGKLEAARKVSCEWQYNSCYIHVDKARCERDIYRAAAAPTIGCATNAFRRVSYFLKLVWTDIVLSVIFRCTESRESFSIFLKPPTDVYTNVIRACVVVATGYLAIVFKCVRFYELCMYGSAVLKTPICQTDCAWTKVNVLTTKKKVNRSNAYTHH